MISWPLFKQSVKANFSRWIIVTIASCFIVATVIIILGNLDISEIKTSLEGLFEDSDRQAEIQGEAIDNFKDLKKVYDESLDNYKSKTDLVNRAIEGTATEEEYKELGDEFVNAINELKSGEDKVKNGESELSSAENKLSSSKKTYASSKSNYEKQLETLNSQKKQIEDGISKCDSGLKQIEDGLNQVSQYDSQIEQYKSQFATAQSNLDKVNAGIAQFDSQIENAQTDEQKNAIKSSDQYKALITQKTGLEQILKLKQASDTKDQLQAKKTETENTKKDLQSKLQQVTDGINKINSGLASGESQIKTAESKIESSKADLQSATEKITSSKETLKTESIKTIKEKIADEVKNQAIEKGSQEDTAEKLKQESIKIIEKYENGEDVEDDKKIEMASNFLSQEFYDEAIKDGYSEKEASLAKTIAVTAISSYNSRIISGETEETARLETTKSLIEELPKDVADAIIEIKDMNIYGLVVGNILFRIAGLLLPMIFVIMTANSLISGQVDSGSMAYILSTPIKRKKVAFTQMVYLIFSVFLMYALITLTGVISINFAHNSDFTLTRKDIVYFGFGAVMVIFAISGICYLASSIFDREKNSLSVGGGISMFFLVCSILGIFGEKVIPSIIRIDAMNYFNYASIISLFDVNSMLEGTSNWHTGIIYLFLIGIICYIIGINKFDRKDLPL